MNSPGVQAAVDSIQSGTAAPPTTVPTYDQVIGDAAAYYKQQGGSQADVDAYIAAHPERNVIDVSRDAINWYTDPNRRDSSPVSSVGPAQRDDVATNRRDQDAINYFYAPRQSNSHPLDNVGPAERDPDTAAPITPKPFVGNDGNPTTLDGPGSYYDWINQQNKTNGVDANNRRIEKEFGAGSGTIYDPWTFPRSQLTSKQELEAANATNTYGQNPGWYPGMPAAPAVTPPPGVTPPVTAAPVNPVAPTPQVKPETWDEYQMRLRKARQVNPQGDDMNPSITPPPGSDIPPVATTAQMKQRDDYAKSKLAQPTVYTPVL